VIREKKMLIFFDLSDRRKGGRKEDEAEVYNIEDEGDTLPSVYRV